MKISGVDIRPGNILEYEGGIWKVAKIQHTQPGKGGAYMQVEMKNLQDGRKTNVRFRSADTVEKVRLDTKNYQFLYEDGDMLVFMDQESFEQINLPSDLLGDARAFLQDGMEVMLELWEEKPISVQLPQQIEADIVEADAVVKGQLFSTTACASWCRRISRLERALSWTSTNRPMSARLGDPSRRSDIRPRSSGRAGAKQIVRSP